MLHICIFLQSPSPRRAWIEMPKEKITNRNLTSPSPRRAWIEIKILRFPVRFTEESPSPRRAWIEITAIELDDNRTAVALPTEGVD